MEFIFFQTRPRLYNGSYQNIESTETAIWAHFIQDWIKYQMFLKICFVWSFVSINEEKLKNPCMQWIGSDFFP